MVAAVSGKSLVEDEVEDSGGLFGVAKRGGLIVLLGELVGQQATDFEPERHAGCAVSRGFEDAVEIAEKLNVDCTTGEVEVSEDLLDGWIAGGLVCFPRHAINSCAYKA